MADGICPGGIIVETIHLLLKQKSNKIRLVGSHLFEALIANGSTIRNNGTTAHQRQSQYVASNL